VRVRTTGRATKTGLLNAIRSLENEALFACGCAHPDDAPAQRDYYRHVCAVLREVIKAAHEKGDLPVTVEITVDFETGA